MNNDTVKRILSRTMAATAAVLFTMGSPAVTQTADNDPPLNLKTDGFFSVGGKSTLVNGKTYMVGQMYVEMRIPQNQTHPYPIVMLHGGTRSGTTFTGTPDGREGWAQYFARRGYAVYVVDQPGRGRSGYAEAYGPSRVADGESAQRRYLQQSKYKSWPQAHLHTQWPGSGEPDDPVTQQMIGGFLPEIENFTRQQFLTRDALVALLDRIGPAILLTHSQGGAVGWPVADARPDLVKAVVGVEPNGPPVRGVEFIGAPDWFKEGNGISLAYGITSVPMTYDPPVKDATEMKFVKEEKPDGPGLLTCWKQAEPARKLSNLKMPILVVMGEASYHAPYDHCTVKYLEQAGIKPTYIRLADVGIKGNSHVMMQERNSRDIAAVIYGWLEKSVAAAK
jgi:pimeloyl-ACP methyl ester carboxylesterase